MPIADAAVQSSTSPTEMPTADVGVQSGTPPTEMPIADVAVRSDVLPKETVVEDDDSPMPTKVFYGRKRAADVKGFAAAEHLSKRQLPKRQRRPPNRFQ